jgi:hypothetical protein
MESLLKKLTYLNELIKAIKPIKAPSLPTIPAPKAPPQPGLNPGKAAAPKISTGAGPDSKKDPKKVAEQIKSGAMSTKTQKIMLKAQQWSSDDIEKADKEASEQLYHIHQGPHRITDKPMPIGEIIKQHGPVQKLENAGFRLIRHEPKPKLK